MKLAQIRKYRKKPNLLPDMVSGNPLLILALDLPFVIVAATSLKNAVAFSVEMLFIHMVTMFFGWLIASKLPIWQRMFVTTIVSTLMMILSRELVMFVIPDIENSAGMYLYLMAINGVTLIQANFLSRDAKLKNVLKVSILNVLVFSSVMGLVSFIREYLASGTLWGVPMPILFKLEGARSPFFGFIILGVLLALGRYLSHQIASFRILEKVRQDAVNAAKGRENS